MKRYIITEEAHIPLETARKDICDDGITPYTGADDQISEWAMALALHSFHIGQEITEEDLYEAINQAVLQQTLDSLIEKGTIEAIWDGDQVSYRAKPDSEK